MEILVSPNLLSPRTPRRKGLEPSIRPQTKSDPKTGPDSSLTSTAKVALKKKRYGPTGAGTCVHDHDDLNESRPRALYNPDPQACINLTEHPSPESGLNCGLQLAEADLCKEKVVDVKQKSKDQHGWRRVIRNSTPSYAIIRYTEYQTPLC